MFAEWIDSFSPFLFFFKVFEDGSVNVPSTYSGQ